MILKIETLYKDKITDIRYNKKKTVYYLFKIIPIFEKYEYI